MGTTITELVPDFATFNDHEQSVIFDAAEKGRTYFPEDTEERKVEQTVRDLAHGWLIREALRLVKQARADQSQALPQDESLEVTLPPTRDE